MYLLSCRIIFFSLLENLIFGRCSCREINIPKMCIYIAICCALQSLSLMDYIKAHTVTVLRLYMKIYMWKLHISTFLAWLVSRECRCLNSNICQSKKNLIFKLYQWTCAYFLRAKTETLYCWCVYYWKA